MIRLTDKQILKIHETYAEFKSIRKTAALLNLKPNQIFKTLKKGIPKKDIYNNININNNNIYKEGEGNQNLELSENLKDTKTREIPPIDIFKTKIPGLIDNLIFKLLKELKIRYKDLNVRDLSASITQLLNGKMKIEGLKLEESKANLIQEIYGNYENMLSLYKEIQQQHPEDIKVLKELPSPEHEISELERLVKIT